MNEQRKREEEKKKIKEEREEWNEERVEIGFSIKRSQFINLWKSLKGRKILFFCNIELEKWLDYLV